MATKWSLRGTLSGACSCDWGCPCSFDAHAGAGQALRVNSDSVYDHSGKYREFSKFEYSGGMTQLLAAIIKKTTGSDVERFIKKNILTPLGIAKFEWAQLKGEPDADSGLRLRSRDMAKIGLLLVNGGKWNGKRIVPEKLVAEAMAEHTKVSSDKKAGDVVTYGYQMWRWAFIPDENWPSGFIAFIGNGGQEVHIDAKTKVMVVVTAGNYNRNDLKKYSWDIYPDIVFPALLDR